MTRIVAVTSGKSGVGKTHVSLNLALQCSGKGLRTCLFDADVRRTYAGLSPDSVTQRSFDDVIHGTCSLRDILISTQGIDIIPGGVGITAGAELPPHSITHIAQEFSTLAPYDLIIFDAASAMVGSLLSAVPEILLVVTPESAALTDAYALVKQLQRQHYLGQVRVVVNQVESKVQAQHTYAKFREVVRVYQGLDLPLLGSIPYSNEAFQTGEGKAPVLSQFPAISAALAFSELTNRFVSTAPEPAVHPSLLDFWAELTGTLPVSPSSSTAPSKTEAGVAVLTQATEAAFSQDLHSRLARLEIEMARLQQRLGSAQTTPDKTFSESVPTGQSATLSYTGGSRRDSDAKPIRSVRMEQRSTPVDALQLRRVVGRMLVKATLLDASVAAEPVQISVDQLQIEAGNDFRLQPGRYTRISLHCQHIQKPDSFIEEIFSTCAINGCKVRHLGSHVRYWLASDRDGCILLDGDDTDRNCVQVYLAAGGNKQLDTDGLEADAVPRLRRVKEVVRSRDVTPYQLLGKYPHQRLLAEQDEDDSLEIYRVLRRDREPLLCAFHPTDGEFAAGQLPDSLSDRRRI